MDRDITFLPNCPRGVESGRGNKTLDGDGFLKKPFSDEGPRVPSLYPSQSRPSPRQNPPPIPAQVADRPRPQSRSSPGQRVLSPGPQWRTKPPVPVEVKGKEDRSTVRYYPHPSCAWSRVGPGDETRDDGDDEDSGLRRGRGVRARRSGSVRGPLRSLSNPRVVPALGRRSRVPGKLRLPHPGSAGASVSRPPSPVNSPGDPVPPSPSSRAVLVYSIPHRPSPSADASLPP